MATNGPMGITRGVTSWDFNNHYVERNMDNAAYETAHPDNTLTLCGPARLKSITDIGASSGTSSLLALGAIQQLSIGQTKPTQPMMALGSARSFSVSGKAQTQFSIGRLFINGRNLLRGLYHNAVTAGIDVSKFDDIAASSQNDQFFCNLDSELFLIPFGLGVCVRNKSHSLVGSFYIELAMINSYNISFTAGSTMCLENVSGLADRVLPFSLSSLAVNGAINGVGIPKETLDEILDFTSGTGDPNSTGTIEDEIG